MTPIISLCMIVKNEERFLGQCLKSVRHVVNEMIVVDTGSTDNTMKIAQEHGARVYEHAWKGDFSKARNLSLGYTTGDWILILDADEELAQEDIPHVFRCIRKTDVDAYLFSNINFTPDGTCHHRNIRLFRNGKVHYEGIVHNNPVLDGVAAVAPVRIYHHGYNLSPEEMTRKYKRSEALLLKQVKAEPQNTYARANLARNYRLQRDYQKVIAEAEKALAIDNINLFDKQMVLNDLAYARFITGDLKKARQVCLEGLAKNPCHLDFLFILGGVMVRMKKHRQAIEYFNRYLEIRESGEETPGLEGLLIDAYGYQSKAWNNIGNSHREMRNMNAAIKAFEKAIEIDRQEPIYYKNLAGLYLQEGMIKHAFKVLKRAVESDIADDSIKKTFAKMQMMSACEMAT
jgi:glycosyltransferase involved in cell wall biosynthesis